LLSLAISRSADTISCILYIFNSEHFKLNYALKTGSSYLLPKIQNDPLVLNFSYLIIHFKYLLMAIEYTVIQNLDSTVHVCNKLCRSASVYIS
jgi:hypothetical protein